MLESLFRLLFNYRPVVFQQGEFRLVPSTAVSGGSPGRGGNRRNVPDLPRRQVETDARHRIVLAVMRTAILALVLFACSGRCWWSRRRSRSRTSWAS